MNAERARQTFELIEDLARHGQRAGADPRQILTDVAAHAARGRELLTPDETNRRDAETRRGIEGVPIPYDLALDAGFTFPDAGADSVPPAPRL